MRCSVFYMALISSVVIFYFVNYTNASKILCVFPTEGLSHYKAIKPLLLELANRGHYVVVISAFPQDEPVPRLTDINVREVLQPVVASVDTKCQYDAYGISNVLFSLSGFKRNTDNVIQIFNNPEIKKLLRSKEKFDLIITELFKTEILLGFVHVFKDTPFISFTSGGLIPWANPRFQNPDNPAYIPLLQSGYSSVMNFWQRLHNTCLYSIMMTTYNVFYASRFDSMAKKYFGSDLPPLDDIGKNSSLILVNSHHSLFGARPLVPAVIEIGGIHIRPQKALPQDLETFINESKHGVVYFCMGSMLKASTLPEDKRDALIDVFSRLPQRVLWKWENETMPGKPDNVKLVRWMPQRDVLAHPNVRLFISHGGLLGTTEAVHSGVPILGMPFYGDQGVNIAAVVANGAGLRLDFKDLNKDTLYSTITELLNNPKYKENAKDLSERFRDRPQTPLETAVYWTEYVIRHKGAPHMRSAAVDLTWYQYLLLDVIAFMIFVLVASLAVLYYTVKGVYMLIKRTFSKPKHTTKTKKRKHD